MTNLQEIYMEKIASITEKTAAGRPSESTLKQGTLPKAVVVLNPNDSYSKPFIERLDKVLGTMGGGMDRVQFVALDMMKDKHVIDKFGFQVPSLNLIKNQEVVASLPGQNTMENAITEFLNKNRKHLV